MKKRKNLILAFCGSLMAMSPGIQNKNFDVWIEQDEQIIHPSNNTVALQKHEFTIVLQFPEPMGVLVNASFIDKTYELAAKYYSKDQLPGFINTGMAEGLFNDQKEIFVCNDSPNFWHYYNEDENRFNEVTTENNKIVCKRTIANIYNVDDKTYIQIDEAKSPLYLVFMSTIWDNEYNKEIEIHRKFIKIEWID